MTLIALGVATKAALYTLLRISLSALTPALAIFPRNLVLLGISSIDGLAPFRQRSMQLCLIYLAGTVGAFCLDEDVGAVVRLWRNERGPTYGEVESKTDGTDGSASRSPSPHRRERGGGGATPCEEHVASSSTSLFRRSFIPFVPLAMLALVPPLSTLSSSHGPSYSESSISSSLYSSCARLPRAARPYICPLFLAPVASQTVDLVISYYNEDVTQVRRDLEEIRTSPYVASRQNRVVLYNKGPHSADFLREKLALAPADEVVPLPNLGREGATYLSVSALSGKRLLRSARALNSTSWEFPSSICTRSISCCTTIRPSRTSRRRRPTRFPRCGITWPSRRRICADASSPT